MSTGNESIPRFITVRIEDGVWDGRFTLIKALLVKDGIAIAVLNEEIEWFLVGDTEILDVYELVSSYNMSVRVGTEEENVYNDLIHLSVAEFFGKYSLQPTF